MKAAAWVVVILAMLPFYGCAFKRTDLVQTGFVMLEPQLSNVLTEPPKVYEEGGSLIVEGRLDESQAGHIDVLVIAPDGVVAYNAQVDFRRHLIRSPIRGPRRHAPRRTTEHFHYSVQFPGLPPKGSIVRVRHDAQPHDAPARS
jgi:hypothetical protein